MQQRTIWVVMVVVACVALLSAGSAMAVKGGIAQCEDTLAATQDKLAATQSALATCSAQARVEVTGQTIVSESGDDGDIQAGVPFPTPRFTDNGNGTVTDNLTTLIWLKNANCFGGETWQEAVHDANGLHDGSCGLTDGSALGDWRLPNVKELQSLIDFGFTFPALSNAAGTAQWTEGDAFSGVQSLFYWSSTSGAGDPVVAWFVTLFGGGTDVDGKGNAYLVWPVRGGQ